MRDITSVLVHFIQSSLTEGGISVLHLDYRDIRPLYAQITDSVRQQISGGVLVQGDKLPSVRELAVELSINPNTIQRAYRQLEMEGWIATVPGKGCFVCGCPMEAPQEEARTLSILDEAVKKLLAMGYTRRELADRIMEEEKHA